MLEIEVKYRAADEIAFPDRLGAWGAEGGEEREESDLYFNAPHRDFALSDEAFRLRRTDERNSVTYKGPRCDPGTKTRVEFEVALGDGSRAAADFERIVAAIGFRPVAIVRKKRRAWQVTRDGFVLAICLDDVEQVGRYIELEIVAEQPDFERARAVLLRSAAELGLTDQERRSYLELLLLKPK